ncbi:MAG: FtsQ-type POTRA domain-containing protein [Clostridia bacterium]|jgi:cell division protein FtsQ|nr:FtsQ-type POTRA domain-containing protein [Clostridia bacterium]
MNNRAKEKSQNKNTKDKGILDLDNEIIIGIKSLPKVPKTKKAKSQVTENKKSKTKKSKKDSRDTKKKVANKKNKPKEVMRKNVKNKKRQNDDVELRLGIEDEIYKEQRKKKQVKKKPKLTPKQQEIARKKRMIIFRLMKWTSLVALLVGGSIYFLLSSFFNIHSIVISGNEKMTQETIISLSGIELEQNTFKISKSKVEQAIKTNAYIDSVKIKRKLPDTIEIQVVERKPAYMLTLGNAYVYMNTQGYLLEISQEKLELPIITGILTPEDQIQEGNRLYAEDLQKLSNVIQIMDSANNNDIGKLITKINISNKQDYVLELKSEKKNVHVGDTSNLSTKMLYVKKVLQNEKKKEGDIFVNTDLSTKGAVFREKV